MIRKIKYSDKEEYIKMATDFYNSDAVLSPVPKENFEKSSSNKLSVLVWPTISPKYSQAFLK